MCPRSRSGPSLYGAHVSPLDNRRRVACLRLFADFVHGIDWVFVGIGTLPLGSGSQYMTLACVCSVSDGALMYLKELISPFIQLSSGVAAASSVALSGICIVAVAWWRPHSSSGRPSPVRRPFLLCGGLQRRGSGCTLGRHWYIMPTNMCSQSGCSYPNATPHLAWEKNHLDGGSGSRGSPGHSLLILPHNHRSL